MLNWQFTTKTQTCLFLFVSFSGRYTHVKDETALWSGVWVDFGGGDLNVDLGEYNQEARWIHFTGDFLANTERNKLEPIRRGLNIDDGSALVPLGKTETQLFRYLLSNSSTSEIATVHNELVRMVQANKVLLTETVLSTTIINGQEYPIKGVWVIYKDEFNNLHIELVTLLQADDKGYVERDPSKAIYRTLSLNKYKQLDIGMYLENPQLPRSGSRVINPNMKLDKAFYYGLEKLQIMLQLELKSGQVVLLVILLN